MKAQFHGMKSEMDLKSGDIIIYMLCTGFVMKAMFIEPIESEFAVRKLRVLTFGGELIDEPETRIFRCVVV